MPRGVFTRDPVWRQKISERLSGVHRSDLTRAKMSASRQYDKVLQPEQWNAAVEGYMKRLELERELEQDMARALGERRAS